MKYFLDLPTLVRVRERGETPRVLIFTLTPALSLKGEGVCVKAGGRQYAKP